MAKIRPKVTKNGIFWTVSDFPKKSFCTILRSYVQMIRKKVFSHSYNFWGPIRAITSKSNDWDLKNVVNIILKFAKIRQFSNLFHSWVCSVYCLDLGFSGRVCLGNSIGSYSHHKQKPLLMLLEISFNALLSLQSIPFCFFH